MGDSLIGSIQSHKASLVLIAKSCGKNRKKKLHDKCSFYKVDCYEVEDELLSQISYRNISSLAICDEGFAKAIVKEMKG